MVRQAIRHLEIKEEEEIREVKKNNKKKTATEMVLPQFHVYLDCFEKKSSEWFPTSKSWNHAIDLMDDFIPKKQKLYLLSPTKTEEVGSFIDEQFWEGYIRPLKSLMTSLVFFVPKKDLKKWMCQNYRYFNLKTIKNNYPLPLIPELINKIGPSKVFTKLDL